jgi:O-antigen biosynthesis protein
MTISVFTPIHKADAERIRRLYENLSTQVRPPDEWVVLLNGEAKDMPFQHHPWIKVHRTDITGNIGALKHECCRLATGDVLVEVDYDDALVPTALERIESAFEDNGVQVVYSNCVEIDDKGESRTYSAVYGWQQRLANIDGRDQIQMVAFPPQAQYMRRIEWAPNHVRAFWAAAYNRVGGHDKNIAVGDDHDLLCRMYVEFGAQGFYHIDEALYIYSVHSGNTCNAGNRNAEIQAQVDVNYIRHAEAMYLRWAKDNDLNCLDLGGRIGCPPGYESVDLHDADYVADLEQPWPFADGSVGVLRAYHVLEHLHDTIHFFNEAYRVLAPGGFLLIEVPSTNGPGAWSDPTHVRHFNTLSFEYFTNRQYAQYIQPQYKGRFQVARLVEYWWDNPRIPIVSAQLIALKGWYSDRWCGETKI